MRDNCRTATCPPISGDCSKLMDSLCEAHFFAHDLKLYLDTHPDDTTALEMFNEACRQYCACFEAFERCCYPLRECGAGGDSAAAVNGGWDWLCGIWP
ncbi:MAG: spore coat protein CotJB [Oscillospiraceae bacterium]|nr:spore coat protein CotJB [Oscillospiraceae bacterium]